MKKKLISLALAVAISFGGAASVYADSATIASTVNFRSAANENSSIYSTIKTGTRIEVLEKVNAWWLKVSYNGRVGYISSSSKYVNYNPSSPNPQPSNPSTPWESKADSIISSGNRYLGTPYKFGAKAGSGYFDCSLFMQTIFRQNGIDLQRVSRQQSTVGHTVSFSDLRKGDLIFFKAAGSTSSRITHVGVYVGNGKMLNTYGAGGVRYTELTSYWKNRFIVAKRVI
jgi:cell wall-associated NlpC family hydrolase